MIQVMSNILYLRFHVIYMLHTCGLEFGLHNFHNIFILKVSLVVLVTHYSKAYLSTELLGKKVDGLYIDSYLITTVNPFQLVQ